MGKQFTNQNRHRLHRMLKEERERQEELIENINEGSLNESMTESVGELSSYDQHTADAGAEMQAREFDLGLRRAAEATLAQIDEALDRMDQGTYGTCIDCGMSIPLERLEALPFAARCTSCSEEQEHRREGSGDDRDLSFDRSFTDETENVGFDGEDMWQEMARWGTANSPQDDLQGDLDDE